ncbi:MAG: MarR family transcriptional regulator [Anaerolineae bacterium]
MNITHTETLDAVEAFEQALRRLMWLEQKRMEKMLQEHKLTVPKFLVLVALAHGPVGCAIGDLADKLFQSNATMTGIVGRLEAEGLVARKRGGEADRRKVMVKLTAKGRALLERAGESRRVLTRRAVAHFAPQELETFVGLLDRYMNELQEES